MYPTVESIITLVVALGAGVIGGMLGLGGGFLIVPYLSLFLGFPMQKAAGTSLFTTFFTSLSATLTYAYQRRIDYVVGIIIGLAAAFGAFLGAYLTQFLSSNILRIIFGVVALYAGFNMVFKGRKTKTKDFSKNFFLLETFVYKRTLIDNKRERFEYSVDLIVVFIASFAIGLLAGLIGIRGGSLEVPFLTLVAGIPIHVSIATTVFMGIFCSSAGSIVHFILGNISYPTVVFLCIGVFVGGHLGARTSRKIKAEKLRKIFGFIILIIALRMIIPFF